MQPDSLPDSLTSATSNAANRMLTFGSASLSYDFNGNLTSDGTDTFVWNARNQLTSMSGPGLTASFVYDPFGRRVKKTVNGVARDFLYDGVNPIQELSGASIVASHLTGLGIDEYFSRTDSAGTRTFLTDALGATVALTDNTGTVQTEYTYEPFGETTATGAASTNPFQFTGRENDGTTGLYYYRARYYHPVLQRFISEDPIGFAGEDVNLYAYVGNDPVNAIDPDGRFAIVLPLIPPAVIALVDAAVYVGSAAAAAVVLSEILDKIERGEPVTPEDLEEAAKGYKDLKCHTGTPSSGPPDIDPKKPPEDPNLKRLFLLAKLLDLLNKLLGP